MKIYNENAMRTVISWQNANCPFSKQDAAEKLYSKDLWAWDYALPMTFVDRLLENHPELTNVDFYANMVYGYTKGENDIPAYRMGYFLPITPRGCEVLKIIAKFTQTENLIALW